MLPAPSSTSCKGINGWRNLGQGCASDRLTELKAPRCRTYLPTTQRVDRVLHGRHDVLLQRQRSLWRVFILVDVVPPETLLCGELSLPDLLFLAETLELLLDSVAAHGPVGQVEVHLGLCIHLEGVEETAVVLQVEAKEGGGQRAVGGRGFTKQAHAPRTKSQTINLLECDLVHDLGAADLSWV